MYEAINLDIEDDIVYLSGDSGEYEGEIEDGKTSFSIIYDDLDYRISDQYDENNIEDFLGKGHAFVELAKKYDHKWGIERDLVGITIKLNKNKMTQEQLRIQMLAGIITEGQYKTMLNESKFEIIGSDADELLDAISFINGGIEKSPFRDVARLKPLDTTGHQISDGKFSIEVELIPSGKVDEKLPNDSEYIQQINSFLEERGYQSKLYKAN